jgi:hypothetical protein
VIEHHLSLYANVDYDLVTYVELQIAEMQARPGCSSPSSRDVRLAKHHRHDYESVFWLNAASETTLKDSF